MGSDRGTGVLGGVAAEQAGGARMTVFRDEPLLEIIAFIRRCLADGAPIELAVLDPDRGRGRYAGERVEGHVHRPFRVWVDLAERLGLRLLTPRPGEPPLVHLRFEPLAPAGAWRGEPSEKYGAGSEFARIDKREDPGFVLDLADALARVALPPAPRVLDLGVNTGEPLALVMQLMPASRVASATFVGIDHSTSALAAARGRFGDQVQLIEADLNQLADLALGRFDLVISIGTLQSAGIDDRALVRRVVQDHLAPAGAVIFGVPNCRYADGELAYGARMKNFRQPELGLLVKDVAFYRKYLQQHHRQVFVTGKNYLLITAVAQPG
ncbi:MAG TPA: class I SAM-dependent methyltransferase [Kofleriaceae bacterium]